MSDSDDYYTRLNAHELLVGVLFFAITPVVVTFCYCCSLICVVWCLIKKRRRREEENFYKPKSFYTPRGSSLKLERCDSAEVHSDP